MKTYHLKILLLVLTTLVIQSYTQEPSNQCLIYNINFKWLNILKDWVNLASDATSDVIDTAGWIITGSECPTINKYKCAS